MFFIKKKNKLYSRIMTIQNNLPSDHDNDHDNDHCDNDEHGCQCNDDPIIVCVKCKPGKPGKREAGRSESPGVGGACPRGVLHRLDRRVSRDVLGEVCRFSTRTAAPG